MTPPGGVVELPFDDDAPDVARQVIRGRLGTYLSREQMDTLTRLVDELVSGAVRNGRPPVLLRIAISADPSSVQVSVVDSSSPADRAQSVAPAFAGSAMVTVPGARWGVDELDAGGRRWWVELDA